MKTLTIYITIGHVPDVLSDFPFLTNQQVIDVTHAPDFDIVVMELQGVDLTYIQRLILEKHQYVVAFNEY